MLRSRRFTTLARTLACCVCLALAWPVLTRADTARFEIKAEPLPSALKVFAQQAHMQLLYEYTIVRDIRGNPVVGVIEKHAALEQLLRNTGLEAIFSASNGATIRPIRSTSGTPKPSGTRGDGKTQERKSVSPRKLPAAAKEDTSLAAVGSNTSAQQAFENNDPSPLQEVIVTAQKYRQRAFDVPISLVVLESQELRRREIDTPEDLQFAVPGLVVQGGGVQRRISLRGVSNMFGNGSAVGEYVDDADVSSEALAGANGYGQLDTRMYDLERVEVLRGPQGTLFGVGAMGGVIRFITNRPVLDRFQMSSEVTAMFTQYGAPSQRIEEMINTPIVTDTLGLRFAGEFEHDGGWIDIPAANLKNINSGNLTDVRIEARWQPSERFKVNAMQVIHRNAYGLSEGEYSVGTYKTVFNLAVTPNGLENSNLSNMTMTYDFDRAQLLSSTTYYDHVVHAMNREDYLTDSGGLEVFQPQTIYSERDYSEELRLSHAHGGAWQWTVGSFYKHFSDVGAYPDGDYVGFGATLPTAPILVGYSLNSLSNSWSTFADTSYRLFNKLTLGAGLRYFKDRESSNNTFSSPQEATFTSTDPRIYVRYQVSSNINAYASASKGFRSGGFNQLGQPPYGPESLWAYELGTKIRLLNHRMSVNADVFYSNYSNYVVFGTVAGPQGVPFNIYSNAGLVRIKGIEGAVIWRPNQAWEFSFNGEYLSAKFAEINVLGGSSVNYVGESVDLVPPYSFTGSVERDFRIADRGGYLLLDYAQVGRQRYAGTPPYLGLSDVIRMLGLKAGIRLNEKLTLGVFAQNLLNDRGYLNPFNTEGLANRPRPRTFGMDFEVHFD